VNYSIFLHSPFFLTLVQLTRVHDELEDAHNEVAGMKETRVHNNMERMKERHYVSRVSEEQRSIMYRHFLFFFFFFLI